MLSQLAKSRRSHTQVHLSFPLKLVPSCEIQEVVLAVCDKHSKNLHLGRQKDSKLVREVSEVAPEDLTLPLKD